MISWLFGYGGTVDEGLKKRLKEAERELAEHNPRHDEIVKRVTNCKTQLEKLKATW